MFLKICGVRRASPVFVAKSVRLVRVQQQALMDHKRRQSPQARRKPRTPPQDSQRRSIMAVSRVYCICVDGLRNARSLTCPNSASTSSTFNHCSPSMAMRVASGRVVGRPTHTGQARVHSYKWREEGTEGDRAVACFWCVFIHHTLFDVLGVRLGFCSANNRTWRIALGYRVKIFA
jgi:hypothetical protein